MSSRNFTPRAQEALRLAQEASAQLGHGYVGSEHLLLGLSREGQGAAAHILRSAGLESAALEGAVSKLVGVGAPGCAPTQGLTPRCRRIIELAAQSARGSRGVGTEHLLLGILQEGDGVAARVIADSGVHLQRLYTDVTAALGGQSPLPFRDHRPREGKEDPVRDSKLLESLSRDLTRMAREGKLDPVAGREREIRRVMQILSRRTKNNPVLIGEPGVGKTAVAEGLAMAIADRNAPEALLEKRLLSLDLSAMVAGTKYRGEFEERVKRLLKEVQRAGNIILFLDELHTLVGAGSAEGAIDAANILKPALGRGELQVVGATTREEYRRHIEKDAALERRFQPVQVEEPDEAAAVNILYALRGRYERHHRLVISNEALSAAVTLSRRYIPARFLPDKAVDLMDEAAARVRMAADSPPPEVTELARKHRAALRALEKSVQGQDFEKAAMLRDAEEDFRRQLEKARLDWRAGAARRPCVTGEDVAAVVSDWTGIPVTALTTPEKARLLALEETLHRRVVGQEEAVAAVARAVRRGRTGLKEPGRPVGSFLFCGPSGVGKTELCKALALTLFGSEEALLRFDMSEYMERHTVSRLIGSPPGYVGHEEGGQLTEQVRRRPYSVVLFDELEKAHEEVWNLLLQILEDGVLTDSQGRRVDFRSTVIIMTSNAGARELSDHRQPLGFSPAHDRTSAARQAVQRELKRLFRPEFLNRLDEIVFFRPLAPAEKEQIAALLLTGIAKRLAEEGVTLTWTPAALTLAAAQAADPEYGARPLRRYLRRQVEDRAASLLLAGQLPRGSTLAADGEGGVLSLTPSQPKEKSAS